ncbi:hypothetical protein XELAEV_18047902mg [Xenopus laevis]|uniref:Taste receptor type 2 n=1 Tax=Xenopus laevis TaxID=8355 RepID=A0A974BWD6_XENLA|nr:hypothetical protein XELAEV_18047902mg [Xenopus laevis]
MGFTNLIRQCFVTFHLAILGKFIKRRKFANDGFPGSATLCQPKIHSNTANLLTCEVASRAPNRSEVALALVRQANCVSQRLEKGIEPWCLQSNYSQHGLHQSTNAEHFKMMLLAYQLYIYFTKQLLVTTAFFILNFAISLLLFIGLKRAISTVVVNCLLGIVVSLFFNLMPSIWIFDNNIVPVPFTSTVTWILPTCITFFCIVLTLMSLLKHIHKMKQNASQFWNPQLKSHIKACRTILLLLTMNLIFFLAIYFSSKLQDKAGDVGQYVPWFIIMSDPSSQAIILLFVNSRLATWSKVLFPQ